MFKQEMVRQGFGSSVDGFAGLAGCGLGSLLLLVAQPEAREVMRRAQADAAIEAQDVLSQADEALVMG